MAVQLYDQEVENALASLANPTLDVSVLTSAPQAGLLMNSMSVLAACTMDASLVNERTENCIRLLKTPGSFRASLYQTSSGISDAFRTAHMSMLSISVNLKDVPDIMTSMVTAYAKPEDEGSNFLMNLQMKNFEDIVKLCSDESEKAKLAFDNTLELIRELVQVATATAGDNEEKVGEAKKLLDAFDEQRRVLNEEKQSLLQRIENQRLEIVKAQQNYDKTADKIVNRNVLKSLVMCVSDVTAILSNKSHNSDKDVLESAKQMYMYQRDMEQLLLKEDAANRQAIVDIAIKIANTNADVLNFDEIIYYLSRGVKILGHFQEQWTVLQNFFSSLYTVIVGPMARNMLTFDSIVQQRALQGSDLLKKQLIISGFKAATICVGVSRAANIYNQVSTKFVLPLIDSSVGNLTMSKEEAQAAIGLMEEKMERITNDSHQFIAQQLQNAEETAKEQIENCRNGFKSALESNPALM